MIQARSYPEEHHRRRQIDDRCLHKHHSRKHCRALWGFSRF